MTLLYSEAQPLGWIAPGFTLKGVDEQEHSLEDYLDKKGLLIFFTCNHCPYAKASWPLLVELHKKFGVDIDFIAINSNDPNYEPEDSFDGMKSKATELGLTFPYLFDEAQTVAKSYKAQCTPDLYLFKVVDGSPGLFYHGRINDNWQHPEEAKERNLEDAMQKLVDGQEAPEEQPPSMGCSIKWIEQ